MENYSYKCISPIDGRYNKQTAILQEYFSEYALVKYRIIIEIEYFIELCEYSIGILKNIDKLKYNLLRDIYNRFSNKDMDRIKSIESKTNHDVKAVEYYIREEFDKINLSDYKEMIHFGLTSQDINNTAQPLMIKNALENIFYPIIKELIEKIKTLAVEYKNIPMLARTHGQPATTTTMGKEMLVFVERLNKQFSTLLLVPNSAKFGGATGNMNAHHVTFPEIDWNEFANKFLKRLKLSRSYPTTQIEHYDNIAALCHNMIRINTILIDFCRDLWHYISIEYFKQKINNTEVGSSTMPHKVNPIDFENAEGNLGYANAIFNHLATKLPISRLQRDLTDSTVMRNIGVPFAHSLIAYNSILKGLNKLSINIDKINEDLENNWVIISEAIQSILRSINYPNAYELLKQLTRKNEKLTKKDFDKFIDELNVSDDLKNKLKDITPFNYIGYIGI